MRVKINYEITNASTLHPLFRHFDGQVAEQPAYIDFHTQTGELRAGYSDDIGGGIPSDVWDGTRKRWRISPHLTTYEIRELLDEVADCLSGPGAERYGIDWAALEHLCEAKTTDSAGVLQASDWIDSKGLVEAFIITDRTTDAALNNIVPEIHDLAAGEATLLGVEEYLGQVRDELREAREVI